MRPFPLWNYRAVNVLYLFFFAKDSLFREINLKRLVIEYIRLSIESIGDLAESLNEVLNRFAIDILAWGLKVFYKPGCCFSSQIINQFSAVKNITPPRS